MKAKFALLLLMIFCLVVSLSVLTACGDDDDDDDSSSGDDDDDNDTAGDDDDDDDTASVTVEQFCTKVEECEVDTYVVDGACEASAGTMDSTALNCALQESCSDFIACVEGTDNGWALDSIQMIGSVITISSPDYIFYQLLDDTMPKVSPNELAMANFQYYNQPDCDQGGSDIYVSLDNGPFELVGSLPASAPCIASGENYIEGFLLEGDAMSEGTHQVKAVFVDGNGLQSTPVSNLYQVSDYYGAIGSVMNDFTLWGINPGADDKDAEVLSEISLSDFAGYVILINSSAMWCPSCKTEANELADLYANYSAKATQPFVVLQLMSQDAGGSTPDLSDLQNWADRDNDGTRDLIFPVMADPYSATADPFNFSPYIPFNFILDSTGKCVYKLVGWYEPYISNVLDDLLGVK